MTADARQLTNYQTSVLVDWQNAKARLAEAKTAEATARDVVTQAFFAEQSKGEGTFYHELQNGYRLKAVFKLNYNVSKTKHPDVIGKLAALGDDGDKAAEVAFKYAPELSISGYKKLMPSMQKIVDECVTTSPGAPQYEILDPPKAKE